MGSESRTNLKTGWATIAGCLLAWTLVVASPASAGLAVTTTTVDPQSTLFSAAAQNVTLTATVTNSGGGPVTSGQVTFQVKSGMTNIGTAVTDTTLSATGVASVSYGLPAGTAVGAYTIEASFTDFQTSFDDSMGMNTLTVDPSSPVTFSKVFAPSTIGPGSASQLVFTLTNPGATPVSDLAFTDVLPSGITLATPASAFTDCTNATLTTTAPGTIALAGGQLGAGLSCFVTVNVIGTMTATNTSGDLTSSAGNSGAAVATLTVDSTRLGFSKAFSPSSISLGASSTITFTVTNNDSAPESSLFFTDPLPAGMVVATPANVSNTCGGTVTATPGSSLITLASGSVAGNSSCTVTVDVTTGTNGVFVNTTMELTSSSPAVSGGFATAALDVPIEFLNKVFLDDPVAPGGTVTLQFTIQNPDRINPATAIAFTDPLPVGLTAMAPLSTGTCNGTLSGTTTLMYSGGSLAGGASCSFSVTLMVPAMTAAGDHTNTTTAITATIDGEGVVGNAATDELTVSLAPMFTKQYLTNPVGAGGTTTLRFTITNTSTTLGLIDLAFVDIFDDVTPTASAGLTSTCGGSAVFTPFFDGGMGGTNTPATLALTGGSLAASGTCTLDLTLDVVTNATEGVYPNVTSTITGNLDDTAPTPVEGLPATDDLTVIGGVSLAKEFTDDPVDPPGTVTLEFTLTHSSFASAPATSIAFTDDLTFLTNLTATGLPLTQACDPEGPGGSPGTGTLSGTTFLDFSGGVLDPGESCAFSVTLSVPAAATPGSHTNNTSIVTATVGGLTATGNAASDDLQIATLTLAKEFTDDPVIAGDTANLRFTLTNDSAVAATGIQFTDNLGLGNQSALPGLSAIGLPISACGGTLAASASGPTSVVFTGASVPAGTSCSLDVIVDVPGGAADGTYINTTSGVTSSLGTGDPASDGLIVDSTLLELTKEFTDDPVAPGGTANLRFTLTNLSPVEDLDSIAFSDDLDAALTGLLATGLPVMGCGGTVSTSDGGMTIDFDSGSLAPNATCFFDVAVSVPAVPVGSLAVNTTGGVTGLTLRDEFVVTGDPASDELRIGFLSLTKSFAGPIKAGDLVDLTFTLTNLDSAPASDLGFSDDLDAVVSDLVAIGLPIAACGGTLFTPDGGSTVILVGGSLAAAGSPGDSCSFPVTLAVPSTASHGTFTNTTGDLVQSGVSVGAPAVADLEILPPLEFSKVFLPDTIGPGSTSQLEFTIANLDSGQLADGVAFSDNLPAGLVIASPSSASTDCVDGVLGAPDGGSTISLSGGRLGIGETCTVVVNVTAALPGTYDNLSGELTSTAGSGGTAAATLTVDANLPGFTKSFSPNPIPPGGKSTLTFTIDNAGGGGLAPAARGGIQLGGDEVEFTDVLPSGLVVATLPNASTDCTGGGFATVLTAVPGTGVISLFQGFVGDFSICTVTVDVTAAVAGLYPNVSGELLSGPSGTSSGFATDELDVREDFLVKSFTDDPVPPGSTVTLEFTINNPSRDFPATAIAFTDDLDATLSGLLATGLPFSACGGTVSTPDGGMTIEFGGGSLLAAESCSFSVNLQLPPGVAGTFTNTTSSITATIDGMPEVGNPASDDLVVVPAPILVKEFLDAVTLLPNPVVGAGDDVVIRFTITNTSTTSTATDIAFSDEFTTFLPFQGLTALVPTPNPPCGVGSSVSVVSFGFEREGLALTGGSLAAAPGAGSTCSFDVTLTIPTGVPTNTYVNTTEIITATVDRMMVSGVPATDSFDVVAAPRLTKEFTDDPVQPGNPVTLEFTLTHDANAPGDATGISFTDDLGALTPTVPGLVATGLPLADVCGPGNGTVVGSAGDTLLTFAGATLTPGEVCTFSVTLSVPAAATSGSHSNTTSNVVATVLGVGTTENPASDDLMIGGLVLAKEFTDDPVIAGDTVTLEFVITNDSPDAFTEISFTDDLDAALSGLAAIPPLSTGTCDGTLTGTSVLDYSAGTLAPNTACSFSVTLQVPLGTPSGNYLNRTRNFSASIDLKTQLPFPNATDQLVVANEQLLLTKEFTDDPAVPGGTVTLEFSFSTLGVSDTATDLAFTDDLEAALTGLVAVGPFDTGTCGGTLSGTSQLAFSGGSLTGGECSFSITVQVPATVAFGTTATNTTSQATGKIQGLPVTGEPASDDLLIDFFTFTKSFDGLTKPTGTPVLTFSILNLSAMDAVADLSFSDDLAAMGIPGLVATSLPADPCGLGSTITGTSLLTLSGGNLLPGGSCTFNVDLLVPAVAPFGTFLNVTSRLFQLGTAVAAQTSALLAVDPAPVFTKSFVPDIIFSGASTKLAFSIDNSGSSFAVSGIDFTDNLPAGVVIAQGSDTGTNCVGGILTAVEGSAVVSYTGGSLAAGASCVIELDVESFTPGTYVNTTEELTSSSGSSGAATDVLFVLGPGGPCLAAQGENVTLQDDTVVDFREVEVCDTITVGPNVAVMGPDGVLVLRAGVAVVFLDFSVLTDGTVILEIDPTLQN